MSKFKKKPVVIEAIQWWENGDHPEDNCRVINEFDNTLSEGVVVRYFIIPEISGNNECKHCHNTMHEHGWIDTLEGGHIVCPGDWIITGVQGERYPCKPDIFDATYEAVEDE